MAAFTVAMAVIFSACGGPSRSYKMQLNAQLSQQDYAAAEALLAKNKDFEYGQKNQVLYDFDDGAILHHDGKYKESDASFDRAEQRMEELYTKSVTKTAGMVVLNDTTVDYAGEPFERALAHVYRALNYVFLGMPDEALVESRKVEIFLEELNARFQDKSVYKDDAFARYLDALLYADVGQMDDARISMQKAMEAYAWYATSYGTPTPRFESSSLSVPVPLQGELVFIHYNGLAPLKVSKSFQVAWGQGLAMAHASNDTEAHGTQFTNALRAGITGHAITVAYPEYQAQPCFIQNSEVVVDGAESSPTILMEDIQAIAAKTLQDRMPLIKARAVTRAVVKFVLAKAAADAAGRVCDLKFGSGWQGAVCRSVASGLSQGAAAATEIADTRCWGTLPAQIRMARLKVPAGKHTITVNFKNAVGAIISSHVFSDIEIKKGKRTYLSYRTAI